MHQLMPTSLRPQPETHLLGLWYQTRNSPTSKQLILFIIPKYAQPWLRYIDIMNVIVQIYETYYAYDICYIDIVYHSIRCCISDLSRKTISWLSPEKTGVPIISCAWTTLRKGPPTHPTQASLRCAWTSWTSPKQDKMKENKTIDRKLTILALQSLSHLQPSEASTCRWLNISAQPEPPQVPNPTGSQKQQHDAGNAAHLHDSPSPSGIDANVGDRHAKIVDQPFFWRPGSMQWWVLMARWKPGMEVSQTRETWNCGSRECFPFQKKASALSMAGGEAKHPTISWSWNWTDQLRGICLWNWPEIVRILLLHQVHHPLRSWSWLVVLVGLFKKAKESALGTRPRFSASHCVWYAACSAIPIQQYSPSCSTPRCNMQQTPVPKAPHFHFKCTSVKLLAGQLGYLLKTCISRSFCTDEGCCFFLPQSL